VGREGYFAVAYEAMFEERSTLRNVHNSQPLFAGLTNKPGEKLTLIFLTLLLAIRIT
jgi:hypothetical protein